MRPRDDAEYPADNGAILISVVTPFHVQTPSLFLPPLELKFRIRPHTTLDKMMAAYSTRHGVARESLRFTYMALVRDDRLPPTTARRRTTLRSGGRRVVEREIRDTDTCATLGIHDDDYFDVRHVTDPRAGP